MCGFVGYIQQKKDQVPLQTLKDCLNQVNHRGPDSLGFYTDDYVGFGHHRLSIFDTSDAGNQPMKSDDCVLIFNGAIYNYKELRANLSDYTFKSDSDTEVIIAAYKKWGFDCVQRFNGQWAFVLHDPSKNIIFGSRDKFGIKPFYYLETDAVFWMASEIKSFVPTGIPLVENESKVVDFLQHGIHNHSEETFFDEVFCLDPGANFIYDLHDHSYSIESYYDLNVSISSSSLAEAKDGFQSHFYDSLKYRLRSDVPLGVSLSGGLDSTSIVCGLNKMGTNPLSVSAVYHNKAYSEESLINNTVTHAGVKNIKTIVEEQDVRDELEKVIWHHDQPIASMSVLAQYFNFKRAKKQNIKVMLGGQGADETLMGYDAFLKVQLQKTNNPFQLMRDVLSLAFKNPALIGKAFTRNTGANTFLKLDAGFQWPKVNSTKELSLQLITKTVLPALLHYEDRNAMAHGIESRVPFLDHNLVEFILSVPEEFLINNGVRKYLQRESLKDILPLTIYGDHKKKPFISPQAYWMESNKTHYRDLVKSCGDYIDHIVDMNNIEDISTTELFRILSYASWKKVFFS